MSEEEAVLAPVDQIASPVFPLAKRISVEELIDKVVGREDFVEIDGKIEPKRDMALKLFAVYKLSYDTQLLTQMPVNSQILIAVKARVYQGARGGRKIAEGLGGCTTEETARSGKRAYHDALARAETRAFKRALEAAVGLPFINQLILHLFGGYEVEESVRGEERGVRSEGIAESRLLEALKRCIDKCTTRRHLENWGKKYVDLVRLLSEGGRAALRGYYKERRRSLKHVLDRGAVKVQSPSSASFEEVLRMAKVSTCQEDRELVQDLARELTEAEHLQIEQTLDMCQTSW